MFLREKKLVTKQKSMRGTFKTKMRSILCLRMQRNTSERRDNKIVIIMIIWREVVRV